MSRTNAQNDQQALTAIFRTLLAEQAGFQTTYQRYAGLLNQVRLLVLDSWGSPDAQFVQQVFDDHGPGVILRALADAYDQPTPVLGDLEGD